jgi:hypothetical protein
MLTNSADESDGGYVPINAVTGKVVRGTQVTGYPTNQASGISPGSPVTPDEKTCLERFNWQVAKEIDGGNKAA